MRVWVHSAPGPWPGGGRRKQVGIRENFDTHLRNLTLQKFWQSEINWNNLKPSETKPLFESKRAKQATQTAVQQPCRLLKLGGCIDAGPKVQQIDWRRAYNPTNCQHKKMFFWTIFDVIHFGIFRGKTNKSTVLYHGPMDRCQHGTEREDPVVRNQDHLPLDCQRATSCKIGTRCPKLSRSLSKTQACKSKKLWFPLIPRCPLHHSCIFKVYHAIMQIF